ncbi:MAG: hypothetical protein ACK5Y2_04585 [Bdellovibrionales bacterium]
MKLFAFIFVVAQLTRAQNVGVQVNDAAQAETTTIEIRKGGSSSGPSSPSQSQFQITEGQTDLEADGAPLAKDARKNWTKACDAWKKELRELNKGNEILVHDCGRPTCAFQSGENICTSKATYKLKVKVN